MAGERSAVSKGIAALPILVMAMIHVTVTPLRDMFRVEPLLMYICYGGAFGVGVFLLKRTSQVKDHEYHRSKVMKEMKRVTRPRKKASGRAMLSLVLNSRRGAIETQRTGRDH